MDIIKLNDVCEILNGYAFKSANYVNSGIRIIRITNVQNGYIEDKEPRFYPLSREREIQKYILKENDILISLTGNVGRVALLEKKYLPAALNQRVACLRLKNKIIYKPFLFCFLNSYFFENQCITNSKGIAQLNLSTEWLRDYEIPLYEYKSQVQIADKFHAINKLIGNRKRQLELLDMIVKSRFIEMFGDCVVNPKGWKTKPLEDIAEVGSSKRVFIEELQKSGIPFYRGTEVGALAEGKQINPELFITEEHYTELCKATGAPQIGDLLMPSICPDGRIWVINTDKPFYFKDGRVLWVHAIDNSYNPVFLLHTLKNRIMTNYSSIASGTTFAELKIFALKKCQIYDVPTALQNKFADYAEQTNKSKLAIQKSIEKLEILKKSLMQKYFG